MAQTTGCVDKLNTQIGNINSVHVNTFLKELHILPYKWMNCFIICGFYLFMHYLCLISPTLSSSYAQPHYAQIQCLHLFSVLADVKLFQTRLFRFCLAFYILCSNMCVGIQLNNDFFLLHTFFLLIMTYFHFPNIVPLGYLSLAWI